MKQFCYALVLSRMPFKKEEERIRYREGAKGTLGEEQE